jgi:hypothetical protein
MKSRNFYEKCKIQQLNSLHQPAGLKFKEGTSEMHLEHSLVW